MTIKCPSCSHEFSPSQPAPEPWLEDLITDFSNHADGRPRTSADLHEYFTKYAAATGYPADLFMPQRQLTIALTRRHGWGWARYNGGRRYFPPGNRDYVRDGWGGDIVGLLRRWLEWAQPGPLPAANLNDLFRDYCRRAGGAPASFRPAPGWLTNQLVNNHGWTIRRTNQGRLICPPA